MAPKIRKVCRQGHVFFKSSDCPTCPKCEEQKKPAPGFLATLSAPARRALENAKITTVAKLSKRSRAEILKLHGMGPGSLPKLEQALKAAGLKFKT